MYFTEGLYFLQLQRGILQLQNKVFYEFYNYRQKNFTTTILGKNSLTKYILSELKFHIIFLLQID